MLTMGALLKYAEKAFVLMVAEETITLNSGRTSKTCLSNPNTKSIFRLRSWASSTIITEYRLNNGLALNSINRIPSVMTLMRVSLSVVSSKRIL